MNDNKIADLANFLIDGINNYADLYVNTMPKMIHRKYRVKGKIKKRYLMVYSPIHDFLINPSFPVRYFINSIKNGGARI